MNLSPTCPQIPDDWKGGVSDISEILGLARSTLYKYISQGSLSFSLGSNGRKYFSGREVKRFWRNF